jgi:hypothetical protein
LPTRLFKLIANKQQQLQLDVEITMMMSVLIGGLEVFNKPVDDFGNVFVLEFFYFY